MTCLGRWGQCAAGYAGDVCNLILGRKKLEKQGRSADACRGSREKKKKKIKRERERIQEKRNQVDFELFYGFYNISDVYQV